MMVNPYMGPGQPAGESTGSMRILIADDHALFRKGLILLLGRLYPDAEIMEAADADQAMARLDEGPPPDLVLLDLSMPGMGGVSGVTRFTQKAPEVPVVMLSAHSDPEEILKTINLGARGYILKSSSEEVLKHATSLVLSGEIYMPSSVLGTINATAGKPLPETLANLPHDNPLRSLTGRQRDTLALLVQGQSNKEIARNLGLLESTVKAHVKVILQKLNAANRTQAAMIAADLGWPRDYPSR